MNEKARSHTAEGTAGWRAHHFLHDERPLVYEDPFAIELVSPEWAERCRQGGVNPGMIRPLAVVLGRSRYAEDNLEVAIRSGVDHYVILGAGLDSFALRRPDLLAKIRVYEVDRSATLAWKQERLAQLGYKLPAALEFVACDFERETISKRSVALPSGMTDGHSSPGLVPQCT